MSPPEKRRILKTAIPGPTSLKPQEPRAAQAVSGLGGTYAGNPVACAAAPGCFVRPATYQAAPEPCLLPEARAGNRWSVPRRVNGALEPVVSRP